VRIIPRRELTPEERAERGKLLREALEKFLRYLQERPEEPQRPKRPRRRADPSPFDANGIAAAASSPPAHGALMAMLKPHEWERPEASNQDNVPLYVHKVTGKLSGRLEYYVVVPESAKADAIERAPRELAEQMLAEYGPRTALLHLRTCAAAASRPKGKSEFALSRKQVLAAIGLSKRKDLSAEDKDRLAMEAIRQLQSIGLLIVRLERNGERIEYEARLTPLWVLGVELHGQLCFDAVPPYRRAEDWVLVGKEGLWGEVFLAGDFRQFAALPEAIFELDDERNKLPFALAVTLWFRARVEGKDELLVSNVELVRFHERGEAELDRRDRYKLRRQVLHAISEQERWGWQADFSLWPEELRPECDRLQTDYWGEFLKCQTIFRPIPGSPAALMVDANQRVRRGFLDAPPQAQALPEPEPKAEPAKSIEGGRDLLAARRAMGLTQAQMAARLGITQSLLSYIENGRRPLSATVKTKLEALLKAHEEGEQ
jgi:DNA-binding XRE family transcriptional regulator